MRIVLLPIVSFSLLALLGCGDLEPPSRAPMAPPGILLPTADKPAAPAPAPAKTAAAPAAAPAQNVAPPGQVQSLPPPPPGAQRVVANVGMGQKGHYGKMWVHLEAIWRTKEMLAFKVQIKHSLDLYKATNGVAPTTHEEFMQKIIKENQIELPELPPDHRYVYDPKQEQLMIERPIQ